jgi:hypothetical protein
MLGVDGDNRGRPNQVLSPAEHTVILVVKKPVRAPTADDEDAAFVRSCRTVAIEHRQVGGDKPTDVGLGLVVFSPKHTVS